MSEKWEVVGGGKKKKIGNGQANPVKAQAQQPIQTQSVPTPKSKPKINGRLTKAAKKVAYDYRLKPAEGFTIPNKDESTEQDSGANKPKKKLTKPQQNAGAPAPKRSSGLEGALEKVPCNELSAFYEELRNGGVDDVYLSWIKYSADALNTQLSKVPATDPSQWPNDLEYPNIPSPLLETIHDIITKTVNHIRNDPNDVMGIAFSSLLASIPTIMQRGDPAWGYLLFIREIVRLDPDVILRRERSYAELMESYGNRKEVGVACLWISAQACFNSPSVLRIVMGQIVPYYNFKHYKSFVVSVLNQLAVGDMAGEILVETEDFEDFFEASFDPKKRKDFEKFYPRIKQLTLKSLNGKGSDLFTNFLLRVGEKDFLPLSVYGHETFDILHGCLENDASVVAYWPELLSKFPRESAALLNYLSKNVANVQCAKSLESQFIQSDEFAVAAVKFPELLRSAKKFQVGYRQVEASRKSRLSWKMATYVMLFAIIGLLWLDVTENGRGSFSKSNVGKFLEQYGLLDEALYVGEQVGKWTKIGYGYLAPLFRSIYEGLRPLLQALDKQLQIYIPEFVKFVSTVSETTVSYFNFLTEKVFVGSLSPENLRKITKETLTFVWSNTYFVLTKVVELTGVLVESVKGYIQ